MTKQSSRPNHYYFSNGAHILAKDTQDAFRAFRVAFGATPAILSEVMSAADYDDMAYAILSTNNAD